VASTVHTACRLVDQIAGRLNY